MSSTRRIPSRFRLQPITAALLCGGFASLPAMAQEATPAQPAPASEAPALESLRLPSVTVTDSALRNQVASPKFTATPVDTPQSVSVIPQAVFLQQGAQNLTEVLSNTPGISFNAGENGFGTGTSSFSLRGFDTSGHIFIDGARDSGNYTRDVFNLEQVEVVKGPAADNGRGGAGGYVNLVTKSPLLKDQYLVGASYGVDQYGSDNRHRATVDVNQVVEQGVAMRLNMMLQRGGVPGREEVRKEGMGFAPSIAFGLDGKTHYVLSYQYLSQDDRPDWGIPSNFIEDMTRYNPALDKDGRSNFYGLASDFDDVTAHSLTARVIHDFSPQLKLSNQTRWGRTQRDARYTVPTGVTGNDVTTQVQFFQRDNISVSNLTNLSWQFATGGLSHTLSAGLDLSREESDAGRFPTPNGGNTPIDNPDHERQPGTVAARTQTAAAQIESMALYVYDTVKFNEQWQVTGGLRAERYKASLDSRTETGTPLNGDDFEVSETILGGKLGLVYKPAENGSLYAAVGLSALPPGSFLSNPDISREGDNALPGLVGQNAEDSKVQRAINYEIGTKWEFFDHRLSTALALFHTQRKNVAITGRETGETVTTLKGYGEQIVQGVELSASGRIGERWTVFAGMAFMESERKHSAFLDAARCRANPTDYQAGLTAAGCDALIAAGGGTNGDELAFSPELTANLWATYRFPFGLTLGGGANYVDDSWIGRPDDAERIIPNARPDIGELPGYTVFNAVASYEATPQLTLRLNVDNLTDELYAVSTNWGAQRVMLGDSRSFLMSLDYRF